MRRDGKDWGLGIGGSVFIQWRRKGVGGRVAKQSSAEGLMWMEVEDGEGKLFLAVVYMAPGAFPKIRETNRELMDELSEDIISFREKGRICVLGDLNSRIGELESRVSEEGEEESEKRRRESAHVRIP